MTKVQRHRLRCSCRRGEWPRVKKCRSDGRVGVGEREGCSGRRAGRGGEQRWLKTREEEVRCPVISVTVEAW